MRNTVFLSGRAVLTAVVAALCVVGASCSADTKGNGASVESGRIEMYGDDGAYGFAPGGLESKSVVIRFFNTSDSVHNVKFSTVTGATLPTSELVKPGGTLNVRLPNAPGRWSYVCVIHPGMSGVVTLLPGK